MWQRIFETMLTGLISTGELHVTLPDGTTRRFGPGGGLEVAVRIADEATVRALTRQPELALGEAYTDGRLTVEGDDVAGLIRLMIRNRPWERLPSWVRGTNAVRARLAGLTFHNTKRSARANVAHHYDLSNDLYRLFLDEDMQYSCAYFTDPGMSLEAAQAAKKAHIAAKLRLEPGQRVLDIGCGWGGMALTLARDYGVHVTGVTLSERQLELGLARVAAAGLENRIELRLQDYREVTGRFDRIVSVGMLEHVGLPQFPTYFDKVSDLLEPDGVALIHSIGTASPPAAKNQWIDRYIFPGGYIPSLSELAPVVEAARLWATDIEVLRLHYALTLGHWLERFDANIAAARREFDERFIRMWRYYLIISRVSFEEHMQGVFQIQLAKRIATLPITRDYLYSHPPQGAMREAAE